MPDFSTDEFLNGRTYWSISSPSSKRIKSIPLIYHVCGVIFSNVTNDGAIRINQGSSVLVLEHDTFISITSNQDGGCVLFNPGHSIYQKDICARNVSSGTKSKYCHVSIPKASENFNYLSMISLSDVIWLDGGQMSISYYNSSNNYVKYSPAFCLSNSFGRTNASYINAISGKVITQDIIFATTDCLIQYANFYKNNVVESNIYFFIFSVTCSLDNCVFSNNTATYFYKDYATFTNCSFFGNTFSTVSQSVSYNGTHSFVVNTLCHFGNNINHFKQFSCVSQYFTTNIYLFISFFLFLS